MADAMTFPKTVEEFMEKYKIVDNDQVYTNGAELVPIFRMKQWFEHISATVDAVPVCRCENCVYWDAGTRKRHKDGESEWDEAICDYFHEIGISQTVYTNANWFCADGERKGGDGEREENGKG